MDVESIERKKVSAALQAAKVLKRGYISVLIILMYVCLLYVCTAEEFSNGKERRKILHSQTVESKILSEFKTTTHHREVPPDYRFLLFLVVKSTWRFFSVT